MGRGYPEEISLSVEDFSWLEIKEILDTASNQRLHSFWLEFSNSAKKAIENGEIKKGKILWLLADACSMSLQPESTNNPFVPIIGGCSSTAHIDLFGSSDIMFLQSIIPLIESFRLKARIADIVWLLQKPRNVDNALSAIDAYFSHSLDSENWAGESADSWERGLRLSILLRTAAESRLNEAKQEILKNFEKSTLGDKFFTLKLAELLVLTSLNEEQKERIAEKLTGIADESEAAGNYHLAREFNEFVFRLLTRDEEEEKWKIRAKIAELWAKEAEAAETDNSLAAGQWYAAARNNYKDIPRRYRSEAIDNRINELHRLMNHTNQLAMSEMTVFESPEIDISSQISTYRNHVANRKFPEVLLYYVNASKPIKIENIKESAQGFYRSSIFRQLMSSTHLTHDGRVVARTGGIDISDTDAEGTKQAYWHEMLQIYTWEIELLTRACILPGLKMINLEHRITEADLRELCRSSRLLPQSRVGLWAKGLYYGFEHEFSAASHLLAPQIEHLVRVLLKQEDEKTSTINNGVETECGLSTLLEKEMAKEILGKDLHFELKALLADQLGPNLRNNISHGLLETGYGTSLAEIYLWWFCLRLMIASVAWKKEDTGASKNN